MPGFHEIFREIGDYVTGQAYDEQAESVDDLLFDNPFKSYAVCTAYHTIRNELERIYHFIWNGNKTRKNNLPPNLTLRQSKIKRDPVFSPFFGFQLRLHQNVSFS